MKNYNNYISSDSSVLLGKPILTGTRLSVELILRKLSQGASFENLLAIYPGINQNQLNAVLEYAADIIANEEILTPA